MVSPCNHGIVFQFERGYITSVPSIKNSGGVPTLLLFEPQIAPLKNIWIAEFCSKSVATVKLLAWNHQMATISRL